MPSLPAACPDKVVAYSQLSTYLSPNSSSSLGLLNHYVAGLNSLGPEDGIGHAI